MVISLLFVVAAFIEFAVVLRLHQYNEKRLAKQKIVRKWKMKMNKSSQNESEDALKPRFNIEHIDIAAFSVYGLLYFVFNVVYWLIFMMLNIN